MNKRIHIIFIILIAIAIALGIVLFSAQKAGNGKSLSSVSGVGEKKVLYWTCGMHPTVKADKPGKCPVCSMPLTPVYEEETHGAASSETVSSEEENAYYGCGVKEAGHCPHCDEGKKDAACICGGHSFIERGSALRACPICKKPLKKIDAKDVPQDLKRTAQAPKIIFYRHPMRPDVTSPAPAKDEMGMDYLPVYEEAGSAVSPGSLAGAVSRVHLTKEQVGISGLRTELLIKRRLVKEIRTVGRIAFDPGLAVAQEEFLIALETQQKVAQSPDAGILARARDVVEKSRLRLRLLGMSDAEISELETAGASQRSLVLPQDKAWVYADVYEYDLAWVKEGEPARVTAEAYPGEVFRGVIKAVSPVLDHATRSAKVRLEIDNPGRRLKPEMYVDVIMESTWRNAEGHEEVLAVPQEAVLDTGVRKIVYVDAGSGTFVGREVVTGPQAVDAADAAKPIFYPVVRGLKEGESVVTKGNFLIDSQSQLTSGASVQWGGAMELKSGETGASSNTPASVETQHRH